MAARSALPSDRRPLVAVGCARNVRTAHYHCTIKAGEPGTGAEHAQYIERGGRFSAEKYGEIGAHERGNLPEWAQGSAARFFAMADEYERVNGAPYREFELSLPRELSSDQHVALVREFVAEQLGARHAYTWAIHEPTGENPHVHIMFSERIQDGIEREPELYFKRANRKNPERGGCLKSDRFSGGKTAAERLEAVETFRARWAQVQNQALERAGVEARVDHRSLVDQGIHHREPGRHRGPAVSGIEARGEVSEVGERQRSQTAARQMVRDAVLREERQVERSSVAVERVAVRERRELVPLVAAAPEPDREQLERQVAADRRAQLERAAVSAERRTERRERAYAEAKPSQLPFWGRLVTQARALQQRLGQAFEQVRTWVQQRIREPLQKVKRRAHEQSARTQKTRGAQRKPERAVRDTTALRERLARLNSRELGELIARINPPSVERLVEQDPTVAKIRQETDRQQGLAQQALRAASQAAHESHAWRQAHGVQAKMHDLGVMKAEYLVAREATVLEAERVRGESLKASGRGLEELAHAWAEASARITQETAPARAQVAELRELVSVAYERERLTEEFMHLAQGRAAGHAPYQDGSPAWQATPPKLRQAIDAYNREPAAVQTEILERFARTSVLVNTLGEGLQRRREQVRAQQRDHGSELER